MQQFWQFQRTELSFHYIVFKLPSEYLLMIKHVKIQLKNGAINYKRVTSPLNLLKQNEIIQEKNCLNKIKHGNYILDFESNLENLYIWNNKLKVY